MGKLTPLEEFKIWLIQHDLPTEDMTKLVEYCPNIMETYSMDELVFLSSFMIADLKPTQKSIIIPPIVYNATVLSAMKSQEQIMKHITKILAGHSSGILEREVRARLKAIDKKINTKKNR